MCCCVPFICWRCGNHPHPHNMRKLRPKLRPRRIWTARIQKYCKSVEKRKLRPWSEFPPRQLTQTMVRVSSPAKLRPWSELTAQNGDGGGSWVGEFAHVLRKISLDHWRRTPTITGRHARNEFAKAQEKAFYLGTCKTALLGRPSDSQFGSAKTDPVRFKWGFGEGLLKDKFTFFEAYKSPTPKRRKLLAKFPFL